MRKRQKCIWALAGSLLLLLVECTSGATDDTDVQALESLLKGVKNAAALGWKTGTDPCTDSWRFVKCQGTSVTGLLFGSLGLGGTVTADLNKMKNLQTIQFQNNGFAGPLPSLNGLSALQTAYFTGNSFDTIPADFFVGLGSLTEIYLDENPLNRSSGWSLPADISQSTLLTTLSLSNTSVTGFIPDFLGQMSSLKTLNLAYNRLGGGIPSSFASSNIAELRLNNQQKAPVLSGPIDVVGSMESLTILWLHVNGFTGPIPSGLVNALSLKQLKLNDNQLVGTIPPALTSLSTLQNFTVRNNQLVGAIPKFSKDVDFEFDGNNFCVPTPGEACSPEVTALLDFMEGVQFPSLLTASWTGNDACGAGTPWLGFGCGTGANNVSVLSLANSQLNGTISPSLGNLTTLTQIKLNNNRLKGVIPDSLTKLPLLESVDVSSNLLSAPVPVFPAKVRLVVSGNPLTPATPSTPKAPGAPSNSSSASPDVSSSNKPKSATGAIVGGVVGIIGALLLALGACLLLYKKKGKRFLHLQGSNTVVIHPRGGDSNSDPETVKIVVANHGSGTNSQLNSRTNSGPSEVQVVETGNLVISIHVLREATKNFSESSILGRGGFGVVYKGVLDDGTTIAVKRMEGSVVSNKGLSEFQAEIAVLTKVRHRHLVALLGYCIEGNEKLLVYEYMPQGTLSQHLFECEKLGYKPLDWKQRLSIALDVGRGMEYLHGLAHKSFIHRDLKPSNILLGDDLRAKVSDFGLVKLAPEGKYSVETRLAGTFGYLAPEYAVTGRVTTKADVFSFGVVLMELITGRRALDETQAEENMHLVTWFRRMSIAASKDNKKVLVEAIDRALLDGTNAQDETFLSSVSIVAELAGHCTAREPYQRPDMGHVVNVLAPLVEHWKPSDDEDENGGIDLDMPLPQAVKKWQQLDSSFMDSNINHSDTQSSLPPRPSGFADSFTSDDAR